MWKAQKYLVLLTFLDYLACVNGKRLWVNLKKSLYPWIVLFQWDHYENSKQSSFFRWHVNMMLLTFIERWENVSL